MAEALVNGADLGRLRNFSAGRPPRQRGQSISPGAERRHRTHPGRLAQQILERVGRRRRACHELRNMVCDKAAGPVFVWHTTRGLAGIRVKIPKLRYNRLIY